MLLKTENYDIEGHRVTINEMPCHLAFAFQNAYVVPTSEGKPPTEPKLVDDLFNIYFNKYVLIDGSSARIDLMNLKMVNEIYSKFCMIHYGEAEKKQVEKVLDGLNQKS